MKKGLLRTKWSPFWHLQYILPFLPRDALCLEVGSGIGVLPSNSGSRASWMLLILSNWGGWLDRSPFWSKAGWAWFLQQFCCKACVCCHTFALPGWCYWPTWPDSKGIRYSLFSAFDAESNFGEATTFAAKCAGKWCWWTGVSSRNGKNLTTTLSWGACRRAWLDKRRAQAFISGLFDLQIFLVIRFDEMCTTCTWKRHTESTVFALQVWPTAVERMLDRVFWCLFAF